MRCIILLRSTDTFEAPPSEQEMDDLATFAQAKAFPNVVKGGDCEVRLRWHTPALASA